MSTGAQRRKILIVEDEPSTRNLLYVLLAGLGCDGEVATSGQQALTMIGRERFDAVLLDLRCSDLKAEAEIPQIYDLHASLVGRVLVITGDVADAKTFGLIEKKYLLGIRQSRLEEEFVGRLRALFGIRPSHRTDESQGVIEAHR